MVWYNNMIVLLGPTILESVEPAGTDHVLVVHPWLVPLVKVVDVAIRVVYHTCLQSIFRAWEMEIENS